MIYLGCDHGGWDLKEQLRDYLQRQGYPVTDCGNVVADANDNFTDFVLPVVQGVLANPANRGILICGSGIGVSIAANHHVGIRAALVHNVEYATLARRHNDANVLCLGGRFVSVADAVKMVDAFLNTALDADPKYKHRMNIADGSEQ